MSWSRRHILGVPLFLGACGFQPVYGPNGSGSAFLGRVVVVAPRTREEFLLVERLEERLGRGANPDLTLSHRLALSEQGLAEDALGQIRRFNVLGRLDYTLTDNRSGAVLTSGAVDGFTGFAAAGTTLATLSARQDALARLMTILADQVFQRLQLAQLPA